MAGYSNGLSGGVKNGNGKRERVDQEDDQEFMPLSKRINNIHLSPERLLNGGASSSASYMHTNGVLGHQVNQPLANGYNNGMPPRQFSNSYNDHHQHNGFRGDPPLNGPEFNDTGSNGRGCLHSSGSPEHNLNYQNVSTSEVPAMSIQSSNLVPPNEYPNYHYRPSLSQTANPHYYEANRALFELYIERQLRTNQPPHSNIFGTSSANSVN